MSNKQGADAVKHAGNGVFAVAGAQVVNGNAGSVLAAATAAVSYLFGRRGVAADAASTAEGVAQATLRRDDSRGGAGACTKPLSPCGTFRNTS